MKFVHYLRGAWLAIAMLLALTVAAFAQQYGIYEGGLGRTPGLIPTPIHNSMGPWGLERRRPVFYHRQPQFVPRPMFGPPRIRMRRPISRFPIPISGPGFEEGFGGGFQGHAFRSGFRFRSGFHYRHAEGFDVAPRPVIRYVRPHKRHYVRRRHHRRHYAHRCVTRCYAVRRVPKRNYCTPTQGGPSFSTLVASRPAVTSAPVSYSAPRIEADGSWRGDIQHPLGSEWRVVSGGH